MATNPLANIYNSGSLSLYRPPSESTNAGALYRAPSFNPLNHMLGSLNNPLINLRNQVLPNGGGSYNPGGQSTINPAPINTGVPQTTQNTATLNYDKYRDPKTGNVMTPEEYAIYMGNKVPKGNGEISNYAGNAMTNPNQTANELTTIATNLNNSRNDIATGASDPYKVGNQSGIAYSPTELKAIENAYAGVYDPALNDVFSRLADKKKADEKLAAREEQIFATNENIRQWKATTGTNSGSGSSELAKDIFTQTQLNTAARNAGVSLATIKDMDPDLVNFFYSPPEGKDENGDKKSMWLLFQDDIKAIENGDLDYRTVIDEMETNTSLPEAVRHYLIDQIPNIPMKEKENFFGKLWGNIWSFINPFD